MIITYIVFYCVLLLQLPDSRVIAKYVNYCGNFTGDKKWYILQDITLRIDGGYNSNKTMILRGIPSLRYFTRHSLLRAHIRGKVVLYV